MVTKPVKKNEDPKAADTKNVVESNDLGVIKVHEDVVGNIVKKAVESLKGTVELEGDSLIDSIANLLGNHNKGAIGIDVHDETASIAVKIRVKYGENVPAAAEKVQKIIRDNILKLGGLKTGKIDVFVQRLFEEGEKKEAAE
jgi:uncharacterized alkaline shock family protein YloU